MMLEGLRTGTTRARTEGHTLTVQRQVIAIMTISLTKKLSPNLFNHEAWPLFSRRPDLKDRYSSVAAYTLVWRGSVVDGSSLSVPVFDDLHSYFLRAVGGLDCRLQLFAANLTIQPKNAMVLC